MEKKFVRVPFDVEMAKRISDGGVDGRIVTGSGKHVRIVCWDMRRGCYSILALIECANSEEPCCFDNSGKTKIIEGWLELEVPEYMTYKDGDIIYCESKYGRGQYCKWVAILKGEVDESAGEPYYNEYVSLIIKASEDTGKLEYDDYSDNIDLIRKATQSEIAQLIEALKNDKEDHAKRLLKEFFPEHSNVEKIGKKFELKPFDKVLCRDHDTDIWWADFYSHMTKRGRYHCIGLTWQYCIPYNDRTAHLLGTTDNYNEDEKAME